LAAGIELPLVIVLAMKVLDDRGSVRVALLVVAEPYDPNQRHDGDPRAFLETRRSLPAKARLVQEGESSALPRGWGSDVLGPAAGPTIRNELGYRDSRSAATIYTRPSCL
jgi:hypothetical protein